MEGDDSRGCREGRCVCHASERRKTSFVGVEGLRGVRGTQGKTCDKGMEVSIVEGRKC